MANLISTRINDKLGYKNLYGEIIIEPQFDKGMDVFGSDSISKSPFSSVVKGNKCGIVSEDGVVIIPFLYEEAYPLFDNLFFVRKNDILNDWWVGIIDVNNNIIIPFEYKYITNKGQILQCFKKAISERYYNDVFYNSNGIIFEYSKQNDEVWFNCNGDKIFEGKVIDARFNLLVVEENNKLGLINSNGNQILENKYSEIDCVSYSRCIVRLDEEENWSFGVKNEKGDTIIDFDYKYIRSENGFFFNCFQQCESQRDYKGYKKFSYTSKNGESWLNADGVLIYEGEANILSNELLAVKNNKKWGVITYSGNRIVNFQYDDIIIVHDRLIVGKDNKIGILGKGGEIIINPSYVCIECVNIDTIRNIDDYKDVDVDETILKELINDNYLSFFKSTGIIDTNYLDPSKRDGIEYYNSFFSEKRLQKNNYSFIDFEKTFIVSTEIYSELFSLKEGVLSNSRFDQIYQINNENFIVKMNNKWGVFQSYKKELIIPCEFDRILYKGGHVVLLCQNNLWGAKSIIRKDQCFYSIFNTDIPIFFDDIEILNATQSLFSGKTEENQKYTIVDRMFYDYKNIMLVENNIDKILFYYNDERILCLSNDKYGFISAYGYISIPFKYDEITKRPDNNFNVRIGIKWGVLDLDGREIVQVKYSKQLPIEYIDCVVIDAETGCQGVLDESGKERIPAIFEYLYFPFSSDIILFAISTIGYNVTDSDISRGYAKLGYLTHNGKISIPPKYDNINSYGPYILAGRDGSMLNENEDYSGVFDLYNKIGEMIIGGFTDFRYDSELTYFKFYFGGSLVLDDSHYYERDIYQRHLDPSSCGWVVLDTNLKTIITPNDGVDYQFKRGFIVEIIQNKVEKKTSNTKRRNIAGDRNPLPVEIEISNTYNFPKEIMFKNEPLIYQNYVIIKENCYSKVIRLQDKKSSSIYSDIAFIQDNMFLVRQEDRVGIVDFDGNILIPIEYVAITYPISDYMFGVIETLNHLCNVEFFIKKGDRFSIDKVVTQNELSIVLKDMYNGLYNIQSVEKETSPESITVINSSIFDKEFALKIIEKPKNNCKFYTYEKYWFSNHILLDLQDPRENFYAGDKNDDYDLEDTWNAMTDGMYDDMPDGFDGDFGFMGH